MQQKVIADSSVLINFAIIDELRLLNHYFKKIFIPQEVYNEIVVKGKGKPGCQEVITAIKNKWFEVVEVQDKTLFKLLEKDLDVGEAACIAIAVTEKYDLVLLDEQEAREIADLYKLKKTGTIGVLLRAKFDGKITSLKDVLNRLINESDFWISENLYKMIIKEAKEN